MGKTKGVHYPKRREKLDINKMSFGILEPERKSLYELMMENFEVAKRKTFLQRVVYVGQHFYAVSGDIIPVFENTVKEANEEYCMEKVTGFLLYYQRYFMHIVEGDEDSVCRQIGYLLREVKEHHQNFGTVKLLISLSHIHKRITVDWMYYYGSPPKLLENLTTDCTFEEAGMQYYLCLRKIYSFLVHYIGHVGEESETESYEFGAVGHEKFGQGIVSFDNLQTGFTAVVRDPYSSQLPEEEMFAFIINYPYSLLLQDYFDVYGNIPQRIIYKDKVWPIPSDLIPYDVFSKPFDTITELPKPTQESQPSKLSFDLLAPSESVVQLLENLNT